MREATKMEKKVADKPHLEALCYCKDQLNLILKSSNDKLDHWKRILRAANGEVIFVETSENWRENGNQSSEVFREIECILAKRCEPCKFAVKDDAFWDEISSVSESKGKDVQPDEAKLAIALINRYCHSFPNDGFSSAFPCCHVKVMEEAESVSVVSRLYLPSHSPIYWPFQGSVVIPKEHATPSRIAIAHSESCVAAAVLACNTLHQTGELEKQGPRLAVNSFTFNKADVLCPAEVADGGSGKEGSNKRRRVYERKVPKFIIYNKAIELTVSIAEYANMVTLTTAELDFIQRCHQYVHTDIMYINGDSGEEYFHYEPEKQTYGFYVLPLDVEHKCEDAVEIGNKSIDCHNARFKVFSDELSLEALKIYGSVEKKENVSTQVDASDEESDDRCGSRSSQRSRLNEFDNIYSSVEKKEDVSTQVDASDEESDDRYGSRSSQRSRLNEFDNIYSSVEKEEGDVSTQVDASGEESEDRYGSRSSQRSRLNEFDNIYSSVEKKEGDVSTQVDASDEESDDRCGSRSSQRSRLNEFDNIYSSVEKEGDVSTQVDASDEESDDRYGSRSSQRSRLNEFDNIYSSVEKEGDVSTQVDASGEESEDRYGSRSSQRSRLNEFDNIYSSVEKKEGDVSTQVDASDEESDDDRCGSRSSQRSRLNEFDNIYSSVEKKEGDVSTQVDASGEESEDRCGSRSSQRSRLNDLDNINSIKSSCAEAPRSIVAPSVAFDFLKRVDQELGNLSSSVDPSPIKRRNDFESFRGRVVTAIYMAKPTRYIVSDIVYDMNPLSAFPDPEVAATFSDYYKQRYGIDVHEEQPLLHVRHLPKIINSLAAKYRDSKGRDRPLPSMDSKRQKRARVLLIPELCSIHPIPAPLWQNILYIPSILHRLEAILLAEELRQVIAAETGAGSTEWPVGVELPLVTMGEDVGEYNELRVPLHVGSEEFNETNVSLGWQLVKSEILEDRPDNANETLVTSEEPLEVLSPRCSEGSNGIERSKDRQFKSYDTLVTSEEGPFLSKCKPLKDQPDDACSSLKTSKEILPKGGESGAIISSKPFQAQNMYTQPSSTLILKALTCNGAMDVFKHDRLEMYGDAFIKFAVSLNMYCESPLLNVGKLSFYRGLRVSNRQLFYLGRALDIPSYIFNITFQPLVTWCPHGFRMLKSNTPQDQRLKLHSADQELDLSDNEDDSYGEEKAGVTNPQPNASVEIDGQIHIVASDKMVADTTEAIIGAYLVTTGVKSTLGVMKWLGLDVADDVISESQKLITSALNQTCDPESVKKNDYEHLYTKGGCLLNNEPLGSEFQDMEATIGYSFKNKLLLLQAFTHMSYPRDLNHLHTSYEQLEFLGDALLDYLVTRHLYFTHRTMSPGALTDLRSAVVNSYSFAFLSVQHGFHKHLRSMSPAVFRVVNRFTAMQKDAIRKKMLANPDKIFSCVFVTPDDNDENNDSIEVPKVLADIFESVIGAVFIDSGMDVERTWLVVYHLLKSTFGKINHYADNLPSSPIRQLQEMLPNDVCF
ncbi:hypothetical protein QZH41_017278, partial [Actinostola sp. cb2023]